MMDVWEYDDLNSTMKIRTLSNKMEGVFVLYQVDEAPLHSTMLVRSVDEAPLASSLEVRVGDEVKLNAFLKVMYRGLDGDMDSFLEVIGSTNLESYLDVRPNNRMFGAFEILPPPRNNVEIVSTEDSTTRSRSDLITINYGDSQRMMIGNFSSGSESEHLESFVRFDDIKTFVQDLLVLEKAVVRLYYVGDFINQTNIELHLPSSKWFEMGVTHANKPNPTQLIADKYTINTVERYIEFDVIDLIPRWINGETTNLGLIITSNDNHTTSFYTREGRFKPVLSLSYITNQVQSQGRTDIDSTMFIWGVGTSDPNSMMNSILTVHSDYAYDEKFTGHIYVHRYEVPVEVDFDAFMTVNKPDQHAHLTVTLREDDDRFIGTIAVQIKTGDLRDAFVTVTQPDLLSWFTVDPNMSMKSTMIVRVQNETPLFSLLTVTREAINSFAMIRAYEEDDSFGGHITVKSTFIDKDEDAFIAVTRDRLDSHITIRVEDEYSFDTYLEIPHYNDNESFIGVTRPDLESTLEVRIPFYFEGNLYVKHATELDSTMMIHNISELDGYLDVIAVSYCDAEISISKPDLHGYIYPRVGGEVDLNSYSHIRQRDADDIHSFLMVGRGTFGGYYFII